MSDAGISTNDAGAEKALRALLENPDVMSRAEPPAGYEQRLLASLRAQRPIAAPNFGRKKSPTMWDTVSGFFRSPGVSWSLTGAMAVFLAVIFMVRPGSRPEAAAPEQVATNSKDDLLSQTAAKGGERVVSRWLASVGDTGNRAESASLQGLARDLGSQNRAAVDKALDEVARAMMQTDNKM